MGERRRAVIRHGASSEPADRADAGSRTLHAHREVNSFSELAFGGSATPHHAIAMSCFLRRPDSHGA